MNNSNYGVLVEVINSKVFSKIRSHVNYVNIMRLRDNVNIAYFGHSGVIYSVVYEEDDKKISICSRENPDVKVTVDKNNNQYPVIEALAHIDLYWGKNSFSSYSPGYNSIKHQLSFFNREIKALTTAECSDIFEIVLNADFLANGYVSGKVFDSTDCSTIFTLDIGNNKLSSKDLGLDYEKHYMGDVPSVQDIVSALCELHTLSTATKNTKVTCGDRSL